MLLAMYDEEKEKNRIKIERVSFSKYFHQLNIMPYYLPSIFFFRNTSFLFIKETTHLAVFSALTIWRA